MRGTDVRAACGSRSEEQAFRRRQGPSTSSDIETVRPITPEQGAEPWHGSGSAAPTLARLPTPRLRSSHGKKGLFYVLDPGSQELRTRRLRASDHCPHARMWTRRDGRGGLRQLQRRQQDSPGLHRGNRYAARPLHENRLRLRVSGVPQLHRGRQHLQRRWARQRESLPVRSSCHLELRGWVLGRMG